MRVLRPPEARARRGQVRAHVRTGAPDPLSIKAADCVNVFRQGHLHAFVDPQKPVRRGFRDRSRGCVHVLGRPSGDVNTAPEEATKAAPVLCFEAPRDAFMARRVLSDARRRGARRAFVVPARTEAEMPELMSKDQTATRLDPATAACAECDSTVVDGKKPGRVASKIPPAIRRFILNRDRRRCKVPGCSNRDYLDVHHLVPLADGGTHDPELLACLCDRHHGLIHSGEIRAEGAPGALRFFTREGNEIAARDRAHVRTVELPESARAVLRALGEEWAHPDDLIERAGLPVPDTLGALTVLEIEGLVRRSGGQFSLCGV